MAKDLKTKEEEEVSEDYRNCSCLDWSRLLDRSGFAMAIEDLPNTHRVKSVFDRPTRMREWKQLKHRQRKKGWRLIDQLERDEQSMPDRK